MNRIDRWEFLYQASAFVTVPIFLNTFGPYIKPLPVNPSETVLEFIHQAAARERLNGLFIKAMEIETNTYRIYDETKQSFRFSDAEIARYKDGISLSSNGMSGLFRWIAE